jgi:hypothetical protein
MITRHVFALSLLYLCAEVRLCGLPSEQRESADEIASDVAKASQLQSQRLPAYSVTRQYMVKNKHLKAPAIMQVQLTYKPGAGKQFKVLSSQGVSRLTRRALMKILETEVKGSRRHSDPSSITLDHYAFELDGTEQSDYKLRLVPRHNSKYLLNGYALVQRPNAGIIRVEGRTSKRLSFWVGQAHIVQEFSKYAGFWLPYKTRSTAMIRLVGETELYIESWRISVRVTVNKQRWLLPPVNSFVIAEFG